MRTKRLISLRVDDITIERLQELAPDKNMSVIIRHVLEAITIHASKDVADIIIQKWTYREGKMYDIFRSKIIVEGKIKGGEDFRIE